MKYNMDVHLLYFLLKALFVPAMILALWKKHAVLSFSLAAAVHFAIMVWLNYSSNYGLATAWGDPLPKMPFIRRAFGGASMTLVVFLPVLLVLQLVFRLRFVKRMKSEKKINVFS